MTLVDDLLANEQHDTPVRHPGGWEPHVEEAGTRAAVVSQPTDQDKDERELLADSGLDPDVWRIDGDVQVRRWQQTAGGPWLRYYRFKAVRGVRPDGDVQALLRQVSRHRSKRPETAEPGARVVCLSDWQAGKGEGGGSDALVERVLTLIDTVAALLRDEQPSELVVAGLGDMVEGCTGHYDMQTFQVDLDRRSQTKLVRRLLVKALTTWAPLVPAVTVACVPGNHGENRAGGKAYTTFGDNADVEVFEQAMEILQASPSYEHVRWVIPDDDLVVSLKVAGTIVAFAHGHQFRRGSTPQAKAFEWWRGQALGAHPAGHADVLVTGHYHHLQWVHKYGRQWLQCPALDGGSKWFVTSTGEHDPAGTLTFRLDDGVDHVRVV